MLIELANLSLYSKEPNIIVHNSEGAILLQLLFQVYTGDSALNDVIDAMLRITTERLSTNPIDKSLRRHLLCVYLCSLAYNAQFTLDYFDKLGQLPQFFTQVFDLAASFHNIYERKIFVFGLSSVLNVFAGQAVLNPQIVPMIQ